MCDQQIGTIGARLFHIFTVADYFEGHSGVEFAWLMESPRKLPYPSAAIIAGYDEMDEEEQSMIQGYAHEMFTLEESNQLIKALREKYRVKSLRVVEKVIPIQQPNGGRHIALSALPVGGLQGFLLLGRKEGNPDGERWPLPFLAMGYYDLRGCELAPVPLRGSNDDAFPF